MVVMWGCFMAGVSRIMGFFESTDTLFIIGAILLAGLFIALTVALTRGKNTAISRVLETAGNTERKAAMLEQGTGQ